MTTIQRDAVQVPERPRAATALTAGVVRGLVLLAGAAVLITTVKPIGSLPYYYNPVVTGATFTLAALVSGRRSPLLGSGIVVLAWGLSHVIVAHAFPSAGMGMGMGGHTSAWSFALADTMLGVGAVVAALLASRGFAISPLSVAAPIVFIGLGEYVHGTYGSAITGTLCALTAAWGVEEIARALLARRSPARSGSSAVAPAA